MNNLYPRIAAILSLLVATIGMVYAQTFAPATGIHIQVYGIHYGGNLVYNYKVINNSDAPFSNFTIGSEFYTAENHAYPQLTRLPLGWKYGETGEVGTEIILASGSTNQPTHWSSKVYGQQETNNYYLEWRAPRGVGADDNDIYPGQTLAGFSVTIPPVDSNLFLPFVTGQPVFTGPDDKYVRGGFKVGYGSEKKFLKVWGTLEPLDTTPPTLAVSLTPSTIPPNGKLVPVTAIITVKDDYDPAPEIQLVSITANEPLDRTDAKDVSPGTDDRQFELRAKRKEDNKDGRIYTVTYSATDGTGNKTTASATVTVLHDERGHREREDRHGDKDKKNDKDEHRRDR